MRIKWSDIERWMANCKCYLNKFAYEKSSENFF